MVFAPQPQSALQVPPNNTKAASSRSVEAEKESPGCKRRTKKLIHSHRASARESVNSSPELPSGNRFE